MGLVYRTYREVDPWHYEREYNTDGTEKHITCDGARFHVLSYSWGPTVGFKTMCSEPRCEVNRQPDSADDEHRG